ncbi:MAG: T9SS type A sorting domain-containing protein [Bacteroidetes bacterium]|nr:T9SS type A sorting domain-containing protein [Bacteroidota bacterium]
MRNRNKLSGKTILLVASCAIVLLVSGLILFFNFSNPEKVLAVATGDYRSAATGNWSSTTTWQRYNGTSWVAAISTPTSADGVITIQTGNTVTITASVTVDQVVINSGGTVILNSAKTLTIANGAGTDFDVTGIFKNAGTVTQNLSSTMAFQNGGKYQHNFTTTSGTVPVATWNTGSTCEIIGYTSYNSTLNGLTQNFYNFTWNCPGQISGTGVSLGGSLTTVLGDLNIVSTGAGDVELAWSANANLTVSGNFIQSGGTFTLNGFSGATVLNLAGNVTLTGGTFQKGGGSGAVNFNGTSVQAFSNSGATFSGAINFAILSGANVNFGTNIINGSTGTFDLNSGGAITTANANGITSSGASGSIQVTGTRTYSTGADFTFNGATAQVTGNGIPATVHNLTISNSSNVTLTSTVAVSNILNLTTGILLTGSNEVSITNTATSAITGYSSSNYVSGNLRRSVSGTGSYVFPLGTTSNYELATVNLSGAAGFSNILGTFVNTNPVVVPLSGITVNGTTVDNMLDFGYWTLTPNATMSSGTYDVTLVERGQSNPGPTTQSYTVLSRQNVSSAWQSIGTHNNGTQSVAGGVVTASRSSFPNFNNTHFGIGFSSAGSLPIELIFFNAELNKDVVNLSWATASELNNDYFTVERSSDGKQFEEVLRKRGAGNSTVTIHYSDVDKKPMTGYSYYRLKQTDYDGRFTYSEIKTIKYKPGNDPEQSLKITAVYPNPFDEKFTVNFIMHETADVAFTLVNSSGQLFFKDVIRANDGLNQYDFTERNTLPKGVYVVTLTSGNQMISQKVIKNNLK